jgi:hypothetical protein
MDAAFGGGVLLPACTLVVGGRPLVVVYNRYVAPYQIAMDLYDRDTRELWTPVTINHPGYDDTLTDAAILVRDWAPNEDLPQALVDAGIIGGMPRVIAPNLYAAYPLLKRPPGFTSKEEFAVSKKLMRPLTRLNKKAHVFYKNVIPHTHTHITLICGAGDWRGAARRSQWPSPASAT